MSKRKSSLVHYITDEQIRDASKSASSLSQMMTILGLSGGSTFALLRTRVQNLDLYEKFQDSQVWNRGKTKLTDDRIFSTVSSNKSFTKNSHLKTCRAKAILLNEFDDQDPFCTSCGLTSWLDKPIPLELDHINGDNRDNTRSNLRLLCPNCHALTPTWRGKGKGKSAQKVSDQVLIDALNRSSSIREALLNVGLSCSYNYNRVYKLMIKHNLKLPKT